LTGLRKGRFLERINRFVILCSLGRRTVRAYLPNPGRLWELLLPGRTVYLERNPGGSSTAWTAVAVERDGNPVLLHTHRANDIVEGLLREGRLPGLGGARIVRREAPFGRSRFDFLLEKEGLPFVLEVKSCTLFGRSVAMFPDAVTARGRRHLEELALLAREGMACGAVFLVHSPRVRYFLPDYHTDFDFARTFLDLKDRIFLRAIAVEWTGDLTLGPRVRELEIPWDLLRREARDGGSYLLILTLEKDRVLTVGSLGRMSFRKGFYVYVGSAKTNLQKRIERHRRKNKAHHWHIDYLAGCAESVAAVPVRTNDDLEHDLAAALENISGGSVPGFGCSDCRCGTHLFRMETNPLHSPSFIDLLLHFRIDRLEGPLGGMRT
jgi:sugar fermentation stimulation protein A